MTRFFDMENSMSNKPLLLIATNHSYMFYRFRKELVLALLPYFRIVLSTPLVGHENDLKDMGIDVCSTLMDRRSVNPFKDLKLLRFYTRLINELKPDAVLTFSIKPNVYLGMVCAQKGIRYFSHVQGLGSAFEKKGLASIARQMYQFGLRHSEAIFFENEYDQNYFVTRNLISPNKAVLLPGAGVSLSEFSYVEFPNNPAPRILYLGRLMKEKGTDELLTSLENLHRQNEQFVFDFAGFEEENYQGRINKLVKEGICVIHGFVSDPRPLLAQADLVVLPSWHEGMSNVILEAAATGRPVITTDIPGCHESVEDQITGFLIPAKDQQALEASIKRALHLPKSELEVMGRKAREKMVSEFSKDEVVAKTVSVIRNKVYNLSQ